MSSDEAPARSSRRRRRSVTAAEFESEDESDATQPGPSSRTVESLAKRQRLEDGSPHPLPRRLANGDASSSSSSSSPTPPSRPRPRPPLPSSSQQGSGAADFQPGAIVRVSVQDFITYEKADFYPGPYLNMVLGPNGTGKSSLVCAICLGLGYSAKYLGRAQAVKDYVKHGKDFAIIETELQKRPEDETNFIVKAQIRREQNNTRWWLNNKDASHKAVEDLMKKLRVQVDNLCQFLPQDRVYEFASSTPVALLHETLRAVAPEEMQRWHVELQGLHRDKKEMEEKALAQSETLKTMRNRQAGLQSEVDRFHERQEILKRVKDLEGAVVIANYQEARARFREARTKQKEAAESLKRLERESGPSLEAVNQKQEYAAAVEAAIPPREKALKDALAAADRLSQDIAATEEKLRECDRQTGAERKVYDQRRKDVATSKSKIRNLEADLSKKPADVDFVEWNQKIRAEEHKARDLEADHQKVVADVDSIMTQGKAKQAEKRRLAEDLQALDTRAGQQLSFMRRRFPELAQGWEWVESNQGEFEKPVFGPPIISCSMKDERYSDQVQSLLQLDDFLCFTAQTKNDYKKLTNQLYRVMSLSVVVRTCLNPLAAYRPPVDADEAASLSLDGFAIDYVEGPEPVLAMLCAEKRLHQSGVSLREHSREQYDRLVHHGKISNWAAGAQAYIVRRRREYGPNAMTAVAKNIQSGQFWTSQPVATQEKAELKRRQEEVSGELAMLKERLDEVRVRKADLEAKKVEVLERTNDLKEQKNTLQKEFQKWQMLPQKIESEELHKGKNEERMAEARQRIVELAFQGDEAVLERAQQVLDHTDALHEARAAHRALLDAKLRLVEATSDVGGLTERNQSIMQALEAEKTTVQEATEAARLLREKGHSLGDKVSELLSDVDAEQKARFEQLAQGRTPTDLELDVAAEHANLELIHAANPTVMHEYAQREQDIAKAVRRMDQRAAKLADVQAQLAALMARWEPRLDALVSRINAAFAHNFEQISCAGEVRVHKDPAAFEAWALEILVKFRPDESLQQLNAHRQSGGERSVATVFYLMALQSMAQAPFRVVDEINQGMDPRNERVVLERMVDIACREHSSQYFLVTPKLLTGLRYDPKMRVLCIASGEHMPLRVERLDFRRCLAAQKRFAERLKVK